jgi:hypothetical protein
MRGNMLAMGSATLLPGSVIGGFSIITIARANVVDTSSEDTVNARLRRLEDADKSASCSTIMEARSISGTLAPLQSFSRKTANTSAEADCPR